METISKHDADHTQLIHDVAYNLHGNRMATCSRDQQIKVWDLSASETGEQKWEKSDEWKAAEMPILKVAWAHPVFGDVIACATERTVKIWEEVPNEQRGSGKRWVERVQFLEKVSILDFTYAPKHLGLRISTVSSDGIVRHYEATDLADLSNWTALDEVNVVGSGSKEEVGSYSLSWCKSSNQAPKMIVGCGKQGTKILRYNETHRKWKIAEVMAEQGEVLAVDWAPEAGRGYHLVATGSRDKTSVKIYKVSEESGKEKVKSELVASFGDHGESVWKVQWNVTGTILASSGDDGKVRLWKANYLGEWGCISVISASDERASQMDI